MSPDVDDVVYTVSEDAWKGITGGLRRRDRWFGETQEVV
jgi:hypothetical protein